MQLMDDISSDMLSPLLTSVTASEMNDEDTKLLTRSFIRANASNEESATLSSPHPSNPLSKLEAEILVRGFGENKKGENSEKYDETVSKILQGSGIVAPFIAKNGTAVGAALSFVGTFYEEFKYLLTSFEEYSLKPLYKTLAIGILINRTLDLPSDKRESLLQRVENAKPNHPLVKNRKLNQRQLIEKAPERVRNKIKPVLERNIETPNSNHLKNEIREALNALVEESTVELKNELLKKIQNETETAMRERKLASLNRTVQEIHGAIILGSTILRYLFKDPETADKFSVFANTALKIYESVTLYQLGAIGFFAMTGNIVAGIIVLVELFRNQTSPEEARHNQLVAYLKHIEEMLLKIHQDIISGFNTLINQNYLILNEIRSLSEQIRLGNLTITRRLNEIESHLKQGIEIYLDTSRQLKHEDFVHTIENLNKLISKSTFPNNNDENLYNSYMTDFFVHATTTANLTIFNSFMSSPPSGKELQEKINNEKNIELLIGLASDVAQVLQLGGITRQKLVNPSEWRNGVNNYLIGRIHGNIFSNSQYNEDLKKLWNYGQTFVYVTSSISQLPILQQTFETYKNLLLQMTEKLKIYIEEQKTGNGEKLMAQDYKESQLLSKDFLPGSEHAIYPRKAIKIIEEDKAEYYLFDSADLNEFNPIEEALRLNFLKLQHVHFWTPVPTGPVIIAHSSRAFEIINLTFTEKAGPLSGLIIRFAQQVVPDPHIGPGAQPSTSLPRMMNFTEYATREKTWSTRIKNIIKNFSDKDIANNFGLSELQLKNFKEYAVNGNALGHRSFIKTIEVLLNGYQYKQRLLVANNIPILLHEHFKSESFAEQIDKFEAITASLRFSMQFNWWRQTGNTQSVIMPFYGISNREELTNLIVYGITKRNINQKSISEWFTVTINEMLLESKKENFARIKNLPLSQSAPEVDIVRHQLASYMKTMEIESTHTLNPIILSGIEILPTLVTPSSFFVGYTNQLTERSKLISSLINLNDLKNLNQNVRLTASIKYLTITLDEINSDKLEMLQAIIDTSLKDMIGILQITREKNRIYVYAASFPVIQSILKIFEQSGLTKEVTLIQKSVCTN
jgi:hypothetical protein